MERALCRELLADWRGLAWAAMVSAPSEGHVRALLASAHLCSLCRASSWVLLWAATRRDYLLDFRIAIKVDLHQEEPLSPAPSFRTRM